MKKTLIALALTALPVASMADVVLYGQIKGGVQVSKSEGKVNAKSIKGTTTSIVDYGSYIGFKGHEQLNGNLQAIWQLETDVDIAGGATGVGNQLGNSDSFIGLKGDFGTLKAGNLPTPVKDVNGKLDIWEYAGYNSDAAGLGVFTRDTDAVGRNVAVSYTTPEFAGVTGTAYVAPSESVGETRTNRSKLDSAKYGLGVSYNNAGWFADVAGTYVKGALRNEKDEKNNDILVVTQAGEDGKKGGYQYVAQVGYEADNWLLGVAYQQSRYVETTLDADRAQEVALTGAYNVNNALRLKASGAFGWEVETRTAKVGENGKYFQGIVGADYALSKRTVLNAQAGYLQFGKGGESKTGTTTASVGLAHKF